MSHEIPGPKSKGLREAQIGSAKITDIDPHDHIAPPEVIVNPGLEPWYDSDAVKAIIDALACGSRVPDMTLDKALIEQASAEKAEKAEKARQA